MISNPYKRMGKKIDSAYIHTFRNEVELSQLILNIRQSSIPVTTKRIGTCAFSLNDTNPNKPHSGILFSSLLVVDLLHYKHSFNGDIVITQDIKTKDDFKKGQLPFVANREDIATRRYARYLSKLYIVKETTPREMQEKIKKIKPIIMGGGVANQKYEEISLRQRDSSIEDKSSKYIISELLVQLELNSRINPQPITKKMLQQLIGRCNEKQKILIDHAVEKILCMSRSESKLYFIRGLEQPKVVDFYRNNYRQQIPLIQNEHLIITNQTAIVGIYVDPSSITGVDLAISTYKNLKSKIDLQGTEHYTPYTYDPFEIDGKKITAMNWDDDLLIMTTSGLIEYAKKSLITSINGYKISPKFDFFLQIKPDIRGIKKNGDNLMIIAVKNKNYLAARFFLEYGLSPDSKDAQKRSAAYIATKLGDKAMLQLLANHQANLNIGRDQKSPIVCAAANNSLELVSFLIKNNVEINTKNSKQKSALQLAVSKGYLQIVRELLRAKANVNFINDNGDTLLHIAVRNRFPSIVDLLIGSITNVNKYNDEGYTSLHLASINNDVECIRLILNHDTRFISDVFLAVRDEKLEQKELNCIQLSAYYGATNVLAYFIELLGSKIHTENSFGVTPLHLASKSGHIECMRLLINQDANLDLKDKQGHSAIHATVIHDHPTALRLLFESGANITSLDNSYMSAVELSKKHLNSETFMMTKRCLIELIEIEPDNDNAWYQLGSTLMGTNLTVDVNGEQLDELMCYQKSYAINPNNSMLLNYLSLKIECFNTWQHANFFDGVQVKKIEVLKKAISEDKNNCLAWSNLVCAMKVHELSTTAINGKAYEIYECLAYLKQLPFGEYAFWIAAVNICGDNQIITITDNDQVNNYNKKDCLKKVILDGATATGYYQLLSELMSPGEIVEVLNKSMSKKNLVEMDLQLSKIPFLARSVVPSKRDYTPLEQKKVIKTRSLYLIKNNKFKAVDFLRLAEAMHDNELITVSDKCMSKSDCLAVAINLSSENAYIWSKSREIMIESKIHTINTTLGSFNSNECKVNHWMLTWEPSDIAALEKFLTSVNSANQSSFNLYSGVKSLRSLKIMLIKVALEKNSQAATLWHKLSVLLDASDRIMINSTTYSQEECYFTAIQLNPSAVSNLDQLAQQAYTEATRSDRQNTHNLTVVQRGKETIALLDQLNKNIPTINDNQLRLELNALAKNNARALATIKRMFDANSKPEGVDVHEIDGLEQVWRYIRQQPEPYKTNLIETLVSNLSNARDYDANNNILPNNIICAMGRFQQIIQGTTDAIRITLSDRGLYDDTVPNFEAIHQHARQQLMHLAIASSRLENSTADYESAANQLIKEVHERLYEKAPNFYIKKLLSDLETLKVSCLENL